MPYKILSLDGGGTWALIQARVLQDLYNDAPGHEILKSFNLVIANSGGAMVLAALASNLKPSQIVHIFRNEADRKRVFSKLTLQDAPLWHVVNWFTDKFGPRYSAERKRRGLAAILRDYTGTEELIVRRRMSAIPQIIGLGCPDMIICGYNYATERAVFFRSNVNSLTDNFSSVKYDVTMLDAVHASSNAPLNYFDEPALILRGPYQVDKLRMPEYYWDGAVGGFNNPVVAGLVEALTNNPNLHREQFLVRSIGTSISRRQVLIGKDKGTATEARIFNKNRGNELVITELDKSLAADIRKMATSILADPPDSATFIAYAMLRPDLEQSNAIVRINPCINPVKNDVSGLYEVPKAWGTTASDRKTFIKLLDLDMDAVEQDDVELISRLCDRFIVNTQPCMPNQFIRGDGNGPKTIGFGNYADAKRAWFEETIV